MNPGLPSNLEFENHLRVISTLCLLWIDRTYEGSPARSQEAYVTGQERAG